MPYQRLSVIEATCPIQSDYHALFSVTYYSISSVPFQHTQHAVELCMQAVALLVCR